MALTSAYAPQDRLERPVGHMADLFPERQDALQDGTRPPVEAFVERDATRARTKRPVAAARVDRQQVAGARSVEAGRRCGDELEVRDDPVRDHEPLVHHRPLASDGDGVGHDRIDTDDARSEEQGQRPTPRDVLRGIHRHAPTEADDPIDRWQSLLHVGERPGIERFDEPRGGRVRCDARRSGAQRIGLGHEGIRAGNTDHLGLEETATDPDVRVHRARKKVGVHLHRHGAGSTRSTTISSQPDSQMSSHAAANSGQVLHDGGKDVDRGRPLRRDRLRIAVVED